MLRKPLSRCGEVRQRVRGGWGGVGVVMRSGCGTGGHSVETVCAKQQCNKTGMVN